MDQRLPDPAVAAPPDWRGLCEELLRHAETAQSIAVGDGLWDGDEDDGLFDRARLALAQPEPEVVGPTDEELLREWDLVPGARAYEEDVVDFARAVLARYGRPAPSPAGERQAAPVPVAVSERLPGPDDCAPWPGEPNAGRWCWMASCVDNGWAWEQRTLGFLASFPQDFTHWLPARALPLPTTETQP